MSDPSRHQGTSHWTRRALQANAIRIPVGTWEYEHLPRIIHLSAELSDVLGCRQTVPLAVFLSLTDARRRVHMAEYLRNPHRDVEAFRFAPRGAQKVWLEFLLFEVLQDRVRGTATVVPRLRGRPPGQLSSQFFAMKAWEVHVLAHQLANQLLILELYASPEDTETDRVMRQTLRQSYVLVRAMRETPSPMRILDVVELGEAVGDAMPLLGAAVDPNVWIDHRADSARLTVRLETSALNVILYNLVQNASAAMPSGGQVVISTRKTADRAVIEVRDHGSGMTAETATRAFEPFFSTWGSNGMGLPIALSLIQRVGGTLSLENASGGGTEAAVFLPLDDGRQAEQTPRRDRERGYRGALDG